MKQKQNEFLGESFVKPTICIIMVVHMVHTDIHCACVSWIEDLQTNCKWFEFLSCEKRKTERAFSKSEGGKMSGLHRTETKDLFTYSRFSTATLLELTQHSITQSGGCIFPRINRSKCSYLYFSNVICLGMVSVFPMGCIHWKQSKLSL